MEWNGMDAKVVAGPSVVFRGRFACQSWLLIDSSVAIWPIKVG
jgi:hypothetical protein